MRVKQHWYMLRYLENITGTETTPIVIASPFSNWKKWITYRWNCFQSLFKPNVWSRRPHVLIGRTFPSMRAVPCTTPYCSKCVWWWLESQLTHYNETREKTVAALPFQIIEIFSAPWFQSHRFAHRYCTDVGRVIEWRQWRGPCCINLKVIYFGQITFQMHFPTIFDLPLFHWCDWRQFDTSHRVAIHGILFVFRLIQTRIGKYRQH